MTDSRPPALVPASPLHWTLILGGALSVAADCLSTIAQYLDDLSTAHAVHYQRTQERERTKRDVEEFLADGSLEIRRLTGG